MTQIAPPPIVKAIMRPAAPPPPPYLMPIATSHPPTAPPVVATSHRANPSTRTWIAGAVGILLLVVGFVLALRPEKRSGVAQGELSGVSCSQGICQANITYQDANGKKQSVQGYSLRGDTYREGQTLTLRYKPDAPQDIAISFIPAIVRRAVGWVLLLVGVLLLAWTTWTVMRIRQQQVV